MPPPDRPQSRRTVNLTTRKSVHFRLPFDVLASVDALRGTRDKTDVVVEALQLWCKLAVAKAGRRRSP